MIPFLILENRLTYLPIEIENVNVDALHDLEKEGVKVYPPAKSIATIQNKAKQKLFYVDHNLPTAEFLRFAYKDEMLYCSKTRNPIPFSICLEECTIWLRW